MDPFLDELIVLYFSRELNVTGLILQGYILNKIIAYIVLVTDAHLFLVFLTL